MIHTLIISLFFFLCTVATSEELKVGCIDIEEIFNSYPKTAEVREILATETETARVELQSIEAKIKQLREDLSKPLSKEAKLEKEKELEEYEAALKEKLSEAQERLAKRERELTEALYQDIYDAIEEVAEDKELTLVLSKDVIFWAKEKIDITEDIINILNKRYKEKEEKK